jgi:hypothetical protein
MVFDAAARGVLEKCITSTASKRRQKISSRLKKYNYSNKLTFDSIIMIAVNYGNEI